MFHAAIHAPASTRRRRTDSRHDVMRLILRETTAHANLTAQCRIMSIMLRNDIEPYALYCNGLATIDMIIPCY